ncbi:MAG: GtrA family protein [Xanthobacteraceae bacterium]
MITGGACAVLNNLLVIDFAHAGAGYLTATALAFGPVLAVGYTLHSLFTFGASVSLLSFGRYTLALLTNYPLWIASLFVLCDLCRLPVALAVPLATVILFVFNYILIKWALRNAARAERKG